MAAQSQNIRIRLKAFDYRVLDASTQENRLWTRWWSSTWPPVLTFRFLY